MSTNLFIKMKNIFSLLSRLLFLQSVNRFQTSCKKALQVCVLSCIVTLGRTRELQFALQEFNKLLKLIDHRLLCLELDTYFL